MTIINSNGISVVISALNEEKNIESTINNVLSAASNIGLTNIQIIVIDDGSKDKTFQIASNIASKEPRLFCIKNQINMGLGFSIRRGIEAAYYNKITFIPGDNDLSFDLLTTMFQKAFSADIVMFYFTNEEIRGRKRYILSSIFNIIYVISFNIFVKYINGPAIYTTCELKKIKFFSKRFSIISEINIKMLRKNITYTEINSKRTRDMEGSSSFSIKNLLEAFYIYVYLFFTINFIDKDKYTGFAKRID